MGVRPLKMAGAAAGFACCIAVVLPCKTGPKSPRWEATMAATKILATAFCVLASSAAFADDPLPRAKPEEVGFPSEGRARIAATLNADIEAGRIPGGVIAIARHGKRVALDA